MQYIDIAHKNTARVMTAAFLYNNNNVLLMERSKNRSFSPGVWSGIGGHIEPDEVNSPYKACCREIQEETGITEKDIYNLQLRYIIIRLAQTEIRVSYVYFGNTSVSELIQTDEGMLHWVSEAELISKRYTPTFSKMLEHYILHKNDCNIYVGIAGNDGNQLKMSWSILEDFE